MEKSNLNLKSKIKNYFYYIYLFLLQLLGLTIVYIRNENYSFYNISFFCVFIFTILFFFYLIRKYRIGYAYHYAIIVMLFSISFIEILSLNFEYASKHIFWFVLGSILMFISYYLVRRFNFYKNLYFLYVILILFLFLITIKFGEVKYGSKNWVRVFGHLFQPIEFIKILFILQLASLDKVKYKYLGILNNIFIYIYLLLLLIQHDLGSALILFSVFIVYLLFYEQNYKYTVINILTFIIFAIIGYILFRHVQLRVNIWLSPLKFYNNESYQLVSGLVNLSHGGFLGNGIGLSLNNLIPVNISDMILVCIASDFGMLSLIGVLILFNLLIITGAKLALNISDLFHSKVAILISGLFFIQFYLILLGSFSIIPLTGVTAPFISYGGSSMLSSMILLGAYQSILRKYNYD